MGAYEAHKGTYNALVYVHASHACPRVDIVTAAAFNPVYPHLLATSSGQRKYAPCYSSDEDDSDEEETIDNTLRLWRLPGHYEVHTYDIDA